jgi:hypothetical protein
LVHARTLCWRLNFDWASSDGQGFQLGNTSALTWRHYTESLLLLTYFDTAAQVDTSHPLRQWDTHFASTETVGCSLHEYWNSGLLTSRILKQ